MCDIERSNKCPYKCKHSKESSKCCYLVRNKCIMDKFEEEYLLEILNK